MKGVVCQESKVILLKNERDEWELPGGKLELGEDPEFCCVREIKEELALNVKIGLILDSWVYQIYENINILIITYGCYPEAFLKITHSSEHKDMGLFTFEEVKLLKMPEGYKRSIQKWSEIFAY